MHSLLLIDSAPKTLLLNTEQSEVLLKAVDPSLRVLCVAHLLLLRDGQVRTNARKLCGALR
jgi:hypothetical protein